MDFDLSERKRSVSRLLCAFSAPVLLACGSATTAAPADHSFEEIEEIVERAVAGRSLPGASVAIADKGEIIFARAYGLADVEAKLPATMATLFRLGSISKLVTALAVIRLAEQGRLNLDAPVAEILRDRPSVAHLPPGVTIRRLLNHSSGLDNQTREELQATLVRDATKRDEDAAPVLARDLLTAPGEGWAYSDIGYRLLSWVVERASGLTYGAYVAEELAPGLGLASLRLCEPGAIGHARGYMKAETGFAPALSYSIRGLLGEGGLCATATDLARLPGALVKARWISAEGLRAMTAPTRLADGSIADYGLGVRRGFIGGHPLWGHTGGGAETAWAALAHYPDRQITIAVLGNGGDETTDAVTLQGRLAAAFFDAPVLSGAAVEPQLVTAIPGAYSSGDRKACFRMTAAGLTRRLSPGQPPRTLLHQGGGIFGRADYPLDRFAFQLESGQAVAHRVYYDGFFTELWRREAVSAC
jgi:D-alanyl-D-alanine carboxypeptidase